MYKIIGDNEENRKHRIKNVVILNTDTKELFIHSQCLMSSGGFGTIKDIYNNETDQYYDISNFLFDIGKEV